MRHLSVSRLLPVAGMLAAGMSLAGAAGAAPQYGNDARYQEGHVVRCESTDNRNRQCPIVSAGGVRLVRQLSGKPCIEGRTWGFDNGRLWVAQGCRGEFVASRYGNDGGYGNAGQVLRCESSDGRWRQCAMDTRGRIELTRQLSGAPCIEGRTWGQDQAGVWVNNGCRGEFRSSGYGSIGSSAGARVIRCESSDGRYRQCTADVRGGVRLQRQLSGVNCVEGRTWGVNQMGLWVDAGCRAEFAIGDRGSNIWGWGGDDRYAQPGNGAAPAVRCESADGRTNRCNLPIPGGVRLQRQLSDTRCQQGYNWGWDRSGIWVSGGCRAEFAIW